MIEADSFIYPQMQKTGCTRIGEILIELCGGQSVGRKHGTIAEKPDKLVIGSIRNPWAWYVSLWSFGCEGKGMIRQTIDDLTYHKGVYTTANDVEAFRRWLATVYTLLGPVMTNRYTSIYGNFVDAWVKLENLPTTLHNAILRAGYRLPYSDIVAACEVKSNTSEHKPYMEFYDHKKAQFVLRNEWEIFKRHYDKYI